MGHLKTSQPPAQESRPLSSGRSSVQNGEEIGIVDRALNAASLRKLRRPFSTNGRSERGNSDTNRIVHIVICHDAKCARGGLSEGRVAETKLLNKEGTIAKEVRRLLRAGEWGNWVGLGIVQVRSRKLD